MLNQIYKVSSFLNESELDGFRKISSHFEWKFDNTSHDNSRVFWRKDLWAGFLGQSKEIELGFRKKVESLLNVELETIELYLNGQSHGQCGSFHTDLKEGDDLSAEYITLVYYANETWSPELGGFTVIKDDDGGIHIVYPEPNTAVIFNSKLSHIGLEPTIHCRDMRITLAHKFKVIK